MEKVPGPHGKYRRRRKCFRAASVLLLLPLAVFAAVGEPEPANDPEALRKKPITTAAGQVGQLLRRWWQDDTAAGNVGDWYDNRDGEHSPLNLAPYPQLQKILYSPEDIKLRHHWAAARVVLPKVVFGNSSTSAPPLQGGSNPRLYYSVAQGHHFLHQQYRRNNLYIYPEHRDHDPGHNGKNDGFGDLYPTNTPYLLISQGSSGSDQPFMRALPFTLAAFRPEVKQKLTESGLLMPTIQMLLRSTNKHLKDSKEYLTGKAHPSVFEGSWVDELALVQRAHALELKALPPLVQLKVVGQPTLVPGVDFFEPAGVTESLADTPGVIARIVRGKQLKSVLVVSATDSFDLNKAPLTFTWVVLRGDPTRVAIRPLNKDESVAEIVLQHPERRPIAPGSPLESNRVDIGVFAHNGSHHSAPAFVTFFALDREARTYDEAGKVLEVAHGMGETTFVVTDWEKLLEHLAQPHAAIAGWRLDEKHRQDFAAAATEYRRLHTELQQAQADLKKARDAIQGFRKLLELAEKAVNDFPQQRRDALGDSPAGFVEATCRALVQDAEQRAWQWEKLRALQRSTQPQEKARAEAHLKRLRAWGLLGDDGKLRPLRPGKALTEARWTAFEQAQLESFHAGVLAELVLAETVSARYQVNYVDPRLSAPRAWRDVYRYDGERSLGWTRHSAEGRLEFSADGLLVLERDGQGRCTLARTVRYEQDAVKPSEPNPHPLRLVRGDTYYRYSYADDRDMTGNRLKILPPIEK
jgi:hypothetical protein